MALQPTKHIWHNGKLIPWDQAQIHVMSHVLHYGSSVFEGIRCYKTEQGAAIFRLLDHMQRETAGRSLDVNVEVYRGNVALGAEIAAALADGDGC